MSPTWRIDSELRQGRECRPQLRVHVVLLIMLARQTSIAERRKLVVPEPLRQKHDCSWRHQGRTDLQDDTAGQGKARDATGMQVSKGGKVDDVAAWKLGSSPIGRQSTTWRRSRDCPISDTTLDTFYYLTSTAAITYYPTNARTIPSSAAWQPPARCFPDCISGLCPFVLAFKPTHTSFRNNLV